MFRVFIEQKLNECVNKNQDMEDLNRIATGKSLYLILLLRIDMQMKNFGRRFLKRFMAAFFQNIF